MENKENCYDDHEDKAIKFRISAFILKKKSQRSSSPFLPFKERVKKQIHARWWSLSRYHHLYLLSYWNFQTPDNYEERTCFVYKLLNAQYFVVISQINMPKDICFLCINFLGPWLKSTLFSFISKLLLLLPLFKQACNLRTLFVSWLRNKLIAQDNEKSEISFSLIF